MKREKNEGWLITSGSKYVGSHIGAEFSRFTLPFSIIDHDKNRIGVRLPSTALKYFVDNPSAKDLIPSFLSQAGRYRHCGTGSIKG